MFFDTDLSTDIQEFEESFGCVGGEECEESSDPKTRLSAQQLATRRAMLVDAWERYKAKMHA